MNMQFLMKQAQKIQQDIAKAQKDLTEKEYEGSAGGGAVKVQAKGDHIVTQVTIDPDLMKEDIADVEAMLVLAFNDLTDKILSDREAVMQPITGGAKIPGLM